jgi:hypothetical protein
MTISRRDFLVGAASTAFTLALPARLFAATAADTKAKADALAAAAKSPLIYISPLKEDGSESRCHGEVWFVMDGDDLLVVTSPERWRAACISKGADQARIWVGDFGPWKKSAGGFRQAPTFVAGASIDADRAVHARALEAFGKKYSAGWAEWGPRFEKGLASGERVLLRYTAAS